MKNLRLNSVFINLKAEGRSGLKTKKIVLLSVLTALSIVLNWMENLIFPWTVLPIPGAKIGLANAVFLIIFLLSGIGTALSLSIIRVIILALFTGTIATVMFPLSLGGAVLSLLLIWLARRFWGAKLSLIGLSILGAVGHNLGQIGVLLAMPGLFPGISVFYFIMPVLMLLAIPAGLITGWIAAQAFPAVKAEWED